MKKEWMGPWKCKVCGKLFRCKCKTENCFNDGKCYCVAHTTLSIEEKYKTCLVEPWSSKPRIGKFITGQELCQR